MSETLGPLHLFEAFGVELEYMIVDRRTLAVRPLTDRLLAAVAGEITSDVEVGELAWSNELVLHVVELKTNGPAADLASLPELFQRDVRRIGELLDPLGARLLPTAMHPWMDPLTETHLWPHEYSPIYEAFNRIFDCRGHGWSNLQSAHLNLPFADDGEFGRLHAGVRLLLPLLPALAAASPVVAGGVTGLLDNRMEFYRTNSRRIPEVCARVIPERAFSRAEYEARIFDPLYRAIAPHDPEGVLRDEFLNARGAIARFGRGSLEIRVVDVQECPSADLAVVAATVGALRLLAAERWSSLEEQQAQETDPLADLLLGVIRQGERAQVQDPAYLACLGLPAGNPLSAGEVWRHLLEEARRAGHLPPFAADPLAVILDHGPLARRILRALRAPEERPAAVDRRRLEEVYRRLGDCLEAGELFLP